MAGTNPPAISGKKAEAIAPEATSGGHRSTAPSAVPTTTTATTTTNATTTTTTSVTRFAHAATATGLKRYRNGYVVDQGSGPNLGPPGYDASKKPAVRDAAVREEAVAAAPRAQLPHLRKPLPNGRHPLPTSPVPARAAAGGKKGTGTKDKTVQNDGKEGKGEEKGEEMEE